MVKPAIVIPGQVWRDNDERCTYQEFTILSVAPSFATAQRGPRKTRISLHRLLHENGVRGYTYLGMSK